MDGVTASDLPILGVQVQLIAVSCVVYVATVGLSAVRQRHICDLARV